MLNAIKIYRWLLRLYPTGFREEFQGPMERQFRDDFGEAVSLGDRILLWGRTVGDILASAPAQMVREIRIDLAYTVRAYRSRALASVLTLLALSLAIGACTGVFSVVNALLLRGLPFSQPEQLVEFHLPLVTALKGRQAFYAWASTRPYLQDGATFTSFEVNLLHGGNAFRARATEASANFFQLFGTHIPVGRAFSPDEDKPGAGQGAVLSHHLWMQIFGGDPSALGKHIELNGRSLAVIGVAPPAFDYPRRTDIWTSTAFDGEKVPKRGAVIYNAVGRLKPGLDLSHARQLYQTDIDRADSRSSTPDPMNRRQMLSIREQLAGPAGQAIPLLAGTVVLILTIACANVALLLLSRTTERRQELAVRTALGASRGRLIQQLITEATALTLLASAFGLAIAHWTTQVASHVAPPELAVQFYTIFDWRVLTFAAVLALGTGLLFGAMPVFLIRRLRPVASVRQTHQSTQDPSTRRLRSVLVGLQAALTLGLLVGSLTVGRTFVRLLTTDLGFSPANVLTLTASVQGTSRRGGISEWQYYSESLDRLRAIPGVEAAGAVSYLPLAKDALMRFGFKLDAGQTTTSALVNSATPDYFRALGAGFLAGRDFTVAEAAGKSHVVIVNAAFAERTGLQSVAGRRLVGTWSKTPYTIVGVVNTTSIFGPAHPGEPQVYWPVAEEPPAALTFVARVRGDAAGYAAKLRDAVRTVDAGVPVYDVQTFRQRLSGVLAKPQFYATAMTFLAVLALLLAAIATYGTAAYSVAQRAKEMGIRLALGASYGRVRTMLITQTVAPIAIGLGIGVLCAAAAGLAMDDVTLWGVAAAMLLAAGLLSSWEGTARIVTIDPADTVRAE